MLKYPTTVLKYSSVLLGTVSLHVFPFVSWLLTQRCYILWLMK